MLEYVKGSVYNRLLLISQDKYNDSKNVTKDENYYYRNFAGEDVNIFILDGGFNLNHFEFANFEYYNGKIKINKNDHIAQCLVSIGQDDYKK